MDMKQTLSRREVLRGTGGLVALGGAAALGLTAQAQTQPANAPATGMDHAAMGATNYAGHGANMAMGSVNPATNGFDPMRMLVDWDYGQVSKLGNQVCRCGQGNRDRARHHVPRVDVQRARTGPEHPLHRGRPPANRL